MLASEKIKIEVHEREERLRKIWQVEKPDHDQFPRWLLKKIISASERGEIAGCYSTPTEASMWRDWDDSGWLDHFGTVIETGGREAFVSEPYGLTAEMVIAVQEFAKAIGADAEFSHESWWAPGLTSRITLRERSVREQAGR